MATVNAALVAFIPALFGLIGSMWRPRDYRKIILEDIHIVRDLEALKDVPGDALSGARKQLASDVCSLRRQGSQKIGRATYRALTLTIGISVSFLIMYFVRGLLFDVWSWHWLAWSAAIYGTLLTLLWVIVLVRKLSSLSE